MNGEDIANKVEQEWLVLSSGEIASMLGVTAGEFMEYCGELYPEMDLRYKNIDAKERDSVILDV